MQDSSVAILSNDRHSMVKGNLVILFLRYRGLALTLELTTPQPTNVPVVNTLIDYDVVSHYIILISTHVGEHLNASYSEAYYIRYFWVRLLESTVFLPGLFSRRGSC